MDRDPLVELGCLLYECHKAFYRLSSEDYGAATWEVSDMAHRAGTNINEVAKVLVGTA